MENVEKKRKVHNNGGVVEAEGQTNGKKLCSEAARQRSKQEQQGVRTLRKLPPDHLPLLIRDKGDTKPEGYLQRERFIDLSKCGLEAKNAKSSFRKAGRMGLQPQTWKC
ncbi:hypothetical protein U1Q18_045538 [Sarracenia purpurea var. burkii]